METAEKNLDLSLLLEFYGGLLTPRQREMAEYHYNDDLSLSEIAELCAITRQGVWDGLKKAEKALFGLEERLGIAARFLRQRKALEEAKEAARRLPDSEEKAILLAAVEAALEEA